MLTDPRAARQERAVPWVVEYQAVRERMQATGRQCVYHNSGAFDFPAGLNRQVRGWIGGNDATIRPEMRLFARNVEPPVESNLARRAVEAWQRLAPGPIWIMPKSHWSYELDFGSRDWLGAVLEHAGIDAGLLRGRVNAAAIEFSSAESGSFTHLVESLLRMLFGSDFMLASPSQPLLCTIHHHKQLWWVTDDPAIAAGLDRLMPAD